MFKPGETAGVKSESGRVTVVTVVRNRPRMRVETSEGVLDEADLFVTDPAVLETASGRQESPEEFWAKYRAMAGKEEDSVPPDLRRKVEKALAKTTFDWNGHWKDGSSIRQEYRDQLLKDMFLGSSGLSKKDAEDIVRAARSGRSLSRWVPVSVPSLRLSLRTCSYCGVEDFGLETNGRKLRISGARCRFPEGLPPTEWELNVPSGKIVVANDLRELFPVDEEFDINTTIGCRRTALTYAAVGLAHAFISNTCPSVYLCKNGKFKIANPPKEEEWDGKEWVKVKPKPRFDGKKVASVCTDLWWYSLCDHDEFLRRCKRFKKKLGKSRFDVVVVRPGVYRFRHNEETGRGSGPRECVFARFERVRRPDPVKDLLASYEEVEVNAHAYVLAQTKRWPSLFGKVVEHPGGKETAFPWAEMTEEQRLASWQRVADHALCTIGGGVEWHEKGFPQEKVDPSVPDVDPPSFRTQYHWYPFSKPFGGLFEPKVLAPSFAKLAFRVLESVISFGTNVHDGERSREVVYVRQRMLLAVQRYRELAKKYPKQADPEYVTWLKEKGRAEAWVERFDLGPEFTEKHKKHAAIQRWVPEDAYAVEFDARKLKDGHFAWHPKVMGCWANKKDAQRYAILQWEDNGQAPEHNCFWTSNAAKTTVPLYVVARVKKVGAVSHMGETLVEVAFDYGTPWMKGPSRKAMSEAKEKAGLRVLTKEEYEKLLSPAIQFFEEAEVKASASAKAQGEIRA